MSNRLDDERLGLLLHCLLEGNSCRGAARIAEVGLNTVYRWLDRAAAVCTVIHNERVCRLNLESLQADEMWGFVYVKSKRVDVAKSPPEFSGDVWTWLALDPKTKLLVSCHVGTRGAEDAGVFMADLAGRLNGRVQLTTDGHRPYRDAVAAAFGGEVDFAQLGKTHHVGDDCNELVAVFENVVSGSPVEGLISTSLVERVNRTVRMSNRRLVRRTDGFSKRVRRHDAMMRVLVAYYNFCRKHGTLKASPAMAAGLTERVWNRRELAQTIIERGCAESLRGPYRCGNAQGVSDVVPMRHWGRERAVREDVACANCGSHWMPKDGRDKSGCQRYRCGDCGYRSVGTRVGP